MGEEDVVSSLTFTEDDGYKIVNRLEMFVTNAPQGGEEDEFYLIAYDQGRSSQKMRRGGNFVRVFRNVETRQLKYYLTVDVVIPNRQLNIFYDLFPYDKNILMTSRYEETGTLINIGLCKLDNSERTLYCGKNRATTVQEGFITFQKGRYVELNGHSKTLSVNRIHGDFSKSDWNTEVMHSEGNLTLVDPETAWIRAISVSEYGAIINYDHNDAVEYGLTLSFFFLKNSVVLPGTTGFLWEKNIVVGNLQEESVSLYRVAFETLWVEAFAFKDKVNDLTVTVTDADNSQTATGKVTILDDIHDSAAFTEPKEVTLTSGDSQNIGANIIESGNGVTITAKSLDEKVATVTTTMAQELKITFDSSSQPTGNFYFTGNMCVVETIGHMNKQLVYSSCTQTGAAVSCHVLGNVQLERHDFVHNRIVNLGKNTVVMYTTNQEEGKSKVIIMTEGEFYIQNFDAIVVDINGADSQTDKHNHVVVAYSDKVEYFEVNPNDIQEWNWKGIVDAGTYGVEHFCPVALRRDPLKSLRWDIFSHCITAIHWTSYATIFRLALQSTLLDHHVPISNLDTPKDVCSFGFELLVSTDIRAYGIDIFDDWNYWSVPVTQLGVDRSDWEIDCVENANAAVFWGAADGAQGHTKRIWNIRGDSGFRQDRRYPITWEIEAEALYNYDFMGGILTVAVHNDLVTFMQSFNDPIVTVTAQDVTAQSQTQIELTMTNGHQTAHVAVPVTVNPKQKKSEEKRMLMK